MQIPIVAAPTASGKTALALQLAEHLPLEVISADAMMVYRQLDIGTAKPSPAEQQRLPHHVIDVVNPDESFSVADYVQHAEAAIRAVLARNKLPLVLGGTGFYIQALTQGLPTTPAADDVAQRPLWQQFEEQGIGSLLSELEHFSPADAARAERNPRRVIRALEIIRRTGLAPSSFPRQPPAFDYNLWLILPEMTDLRPRIATRTEAMFATGLVSEVQELLAHYPHLATARQAIGYKEVAAHLAGQLDLLEAKAATTLATVQYAKRQRTWFRKTPASKILPGLASLHLSIVRDWLSSQLEPS